MTSTYVKRATIEVATDTSIATVLKRTSSQSRDAVAEVITATLADFPDVVAAAAAATAAQVVPAVQAAIDDLADSGELVLESDFTPTAGLVSYPGSSPDSSARYRVRPTSYAAGSSLGGQNTLITATPILVHPTTGTAGVFEVTSDGASMQAVVGTSATTYMHVGVPATPGVCRVTINGLNAVGAAQGLGGYIASLFAPSDFRFLRWGVSGTSRVYVLQKQLGTSLSALTTTPLVASSVVAQVGDVVELVLDSERNLSLRVNGVVAAAYTLTNAEWDLFKDNVQAGVYSTPSSGSVPKLGTWEWAGALASASRKMVTVPATGGALPAGVTLSPDMRTEVNGLIGAGRRFSIRDFGAKMDTILITDAAMTAGQPQVSSASRAFTAADIGKTIYVIGAGPVSAYANDGVLIAQITGVTGGVATVNANATSTVAGARCGFGTPDDAAFAAAFAAASASSGISFGLTGGTVVIPAGRTMATVPTPVPSMVDVAGEGGQRSIVHVVMDRPGNAGAAGVTDWLTCAGRSEANPLYGAKFYDFGIEAEAMIHTVGYGSALKPLNIYYVQRCSIERVTVRNAPATAIPFDHSYDQCFIRDNIIINPGRLAPSGVGPGGSGIGAGTKGSGATEPTVIEGNVIIGSWSATNAANGHNGIFTEAQTGADPDAGVPGYRIVNNTIIGMYFGISDAGTTGLIITGNIVIGCARGIAVRKTTLPDAYPGLSTIIANNVIRGCTGPDTQDGVGIAISTPTGTAGNVRSYLHTLIHDNQVIDNKSWGISISAGDYDITGVDVHDNQVLRNGRSGIRLVSLSGSKLKRPSIHHNLIVNNGRRAIAGDQSAILVAPGTTIDRGRIEDNDWWDDQSTATQTAGLTTTGATLTSVRTGGNGDL